MGDTLVGNVPAKNETPTAIAASGSLVAVGDDANVVQIYSVDASHKLSPQEKLTRSTAQITALEFSPNGSLLAVGNSPGKRVKAANAHKDGVNGVSWLDGGKKIASTGGD